ncbi:unknown similar to AMEV120 [Choristoneura rosaceana entomopoxvirus 'L']|uniref:Uncharacterized protein n=1 Tax=Choristoneura rosaceana entomopoxvirus 'L' TaxID=1293539 RepID=A0ABM9QKH2_9POXV|nr:unknown similar to AMEV120 [Choristoneura rosaceana entomopoxvirus 'L']CCU56038.1 unknown similar to AMEV120 [Choristoneura rosaceana entomopoxvirus 'L']
MAELIKPCLTMNLDDLYIDGPKFSRKVTHVLNNVQNKYIKSPEATLQYLDSLCAGVKQPIKKKQRVNNPNKEKINELIGEYQIDGELYCLKCKKKTGNKSSAKVYNTGKALRLECECCSCGTTKSTFTNKKNLSNSKKIK